jgi:hypothetical protein
MVRFCFCGRSLGDEAFGGEWLVRRHLPDVLSWCSSFLLDLGEQPGLSRGSCPRSLRIIMCETVGLDDYGAQLNDAAAARVVEVHKRNTGPGHCILQERDRRRRW